MLGKAVVTRPGGENTQWTFAISGLLSTNHIRPEQINIYKQLCSLAFAACLCRASRVFVLHCKSNPCDSMNEAETAWKSEICLVPQDQIEHLIPAVLDAEKREWLQSCSPVTSSTNSLREEGSRPGDTNSVGVGLRLLRYA